MSKTYMTVQGDKWDSIAHNELGDVAHTDKLLQANPQYHDLYIFPAGIELELPDVDPMTDASLASLPPWKQVAG